MLKKKKKIYIGLPAPISMSVNSEKQYDFEELIDWSTNTTPV